MRKSTKGRRVQVIQAIERKSNGSPVKNINGKHIPIPGKFKYITHVR